MNYTIFLRLVIELTIIIILTVKAKTERTKQFGKSVLFYRLTALVFLLAYYLPIIFNGVTLSFLFVAISVLSLIYYFKKKSLIARDYAILLIAFILFTNIVHWISLIILIYMFIKDFKPKTKTKTKTTSKMGKALKLSIIVICGVLAVLTAILFL